MSSLLNYCSALSGLLPIGAAGLRYRSYDRVLRRLAWFFWVAGLFDLLAAILDAWHLPNLPLFHVFAVVNLLFLSALYYRTLRGRWLRAAIGLAAGGLLLLTAYTALRPGELHAFPSRSLTSQCVLFMLLALLYFYQLLRQPTVVPIEHNPLFWINAGVLVYFSGNLFLFMLQEWLSREALAQHANYWVIHSVVNIIANLLYATGLLCKPHRPI